MVRIRQRLALAVFVFTGFLTPARGGPVLNGGAPNPTQLDQPGGGYYVIAQTAVADALAWSKSLPTPAEIIQNCMNAELASADPPQEANWPIPIQGATFPDLSFTANTQAKPNNYGAYADPTFCGAIMNLTTQNWPANDHWLQLVHTNYSVPSVPSGSTWKDPNNNGFWLVDNNNSPGKPFYDTAFETQGQPPIFYDSALGSWTGTDFFTAYLFVAEMDDVTKVITLHDVVTWGWTEPNIDPTPEPSSITLLLIGSGALGLISYARRRKIAY